MFPFLWKTFLQTICNANRIICVKLAFCDQLLSLSIPLSLITWLSKKRYLVGIFFSIIFVYFSVYPHKINDDFRSAMRRTPRFMRWVPQCNAANPTLYAMSSSVQCGEPHALWDEFRSAMRRTTRFMQWVPRCSANSTLYAISSAVQYGELHALCDEFRSATRWTPRFIRWVSRQFVVYTVTIISCPLKPF